MDISLIRKYYLARGLQFPSHKSALLFFLSEVGELAQAYEAIESAVLSDEERQLMRDFAQAGLHADEVVSRIPGWVRNNDRTRKENISYEIADCLMMLSVFSYTFDGREASHALLEKMEKKLGYPLSDMP